MPRPTKGARLKRRKNGVFYIYDGTDGDRRISTGTSDSGEAESALAHYIATKGRPCGPASPHEMTVADVLDIYGTERAPQTRDPARIGDCIRALVPVLGPLPLSDISGAVCRRYAKTRDRAPGTIRKELGTLAAAINFAHAEGHITAAPRVKLPPKPAPRDRWLTRDEAAKLIRAAYRNPKSRHLARFLLVAVYSGTRSDAILRLGFMPNTVGGWCDTEAGVLYRRADGEAETKKRTPTVPIPPRLLVHLRRWERQGARYVVEADGQRVASLKTAWRTALARAGIPHCTKHDLRHTAVTWAMRNGADKWAAAGFFGLSLDMLESVYGHHHPDHLGSAVEAVGRRPGAEHKRTTVRLYPSESGQTG